MLPQCKLCRKNKPLIKSHIIPQFLFPREGSILVTNKSPYPKRRPIGSYDSTILCEDCDSLVIGKFDSFANKVLMHGEGVIIEPFLKIYRLEDKVGYDIIARFFISILWRASISTHEDFSDVNLGPYELIAKKVIEDSAYDYSPYFSISLGLLSDLQQPINMFTGKRKKIEGVNFYILIIGFFKVMIKCDQQKLPVIFHSSILSAKSNILMLATKFENCFEYPTYLKAQQKLLAINKK